MHFFTFSIWIPIQKHFKKISEMFQLKKWNISEMLRNISAAKKQIFSLKDFWKVKMSAILPHEIFVQYMRHGFKCLKVLQKDLRNIFETISQQS